MPPPSPAAFDRATHCHELNTTLTVIHARAQLLLRRVERRGLDEEDARWIAEGLHAIVTASGALGSVIAGLCTPPPDGPRDVQHADALKPSARRTGEGGS